MIARHIIFICISRVAISVHFISDNKLEMKTDISLNEKLLNEAKVGWSDAISTTSKWYKFRSDEGKDLCDKLDEITATINLVLSQPNPTKKKLEKAIVSVAQREQIQEHAALKNVRFNRQISLTLY